MTLPDLGWWFGQGLNLGHSLSKSEPNELTGQQLQIINSSKGDMKLDKLYQKLISMPRLSLWAGSHGFPQQ